MDLPENLHDKTGSYPEYLDTGKIVQDRIPPCSLAVHLCTNSNACPMLCHKKAIEGIAWYLRGIMDKGVNYHPGSSCGPECCVYVDFPGDLILGDHNIHEYAFSRMDFVTMYAGCLIAGPASAEPKLHMHLKS